MNYVNIILPFVGGLDALYTACRSWHRGLKMQPEIE